MGALFHHPANGISGNVECSRLPSPPPHYAECIRHGPVTRLPSSVAPQDGNFQVRFLVGAFNTPIFAPVVPL